MKDRIKEVRKRLGLNQESFGNRLNLSKNFVSLLESGGRNPSDRTILDICREFNISETWLRTGEGEMFLSRSRAEELEQFFSELPEDSFKRRLVAVLTRLNEQQWEVLESMAQMLSEEEGDPAPATLEQAIEQEARAEAERYYQDLLDEKRAAAGLSASPEDGGSEKLA